MVTLPELWLPIVASAAVIFVASASHRPKPRDGSRRRCRVRRDHGGALRLVVARGRGGGVTFA